VVGQRVFGIALGYEDLNDHDELRRDPMLAVLSGKLAARREDCAPVAGKSTLNRLELSREIILDLDATDDPVHGEQEGRFFHGSGGDSPASISDLASSCCSACSLFTCLRKFSKSRRPFGPTRSSSLSIISSGVIVRRKPVSSVVVSQRTIFDIATMPPKNACGCFSARTSRTFGPCFRHARSTSAMNAADMLLIVAPPLTSTGSSPN
jgi:hypothetical protein